jgi:hypothetical protein
VTDSSTLRRPGRTGAQSGGLGAVLGILLAFDVVRLSPEQVAAVMAFGTPVVGFAQVLVENRIGRGFLRTVPKKRKRRRRKAPEAA